METESHRRITEFSHFHPEIGTRDSAGPRESGLLSHKLYSYHSEPKILEAAIRRLKVLP